MHINIGAWVLKLPKFWVGGGNGQEIEVFFLGQGKQSSSSLFLQMVASRWKGGTQIIKGEPKQEGRMMGGNWTKLSP